MPHASPLTPHSFLPDFCARRRILTIMLVAELAAMILVLARLESPVRFWETLGTTSLYVQWNALAAAGLLCLIRRQLEGMSHLAAGLTAWLSILLVVATTTEVALWAGAVTEDGTAPLLRHMAIGGLVGAMVLHYLYLRHQWEARIAAEAEARIQALTSRIRPHFLFNSLNTAAALIPQRPETAERVIEDLSHLLRAGMKDLAHWHRLEEELDLVAAYLEIESLRLGERLAVDWQRKPIPADCRVPALVLQPLVENAVYHGIEPSPEGGTITILVSAVRGRLRLEVRNPVVAAARTRQSRGNHMALENIRERLRLAFGALARIDSEIRNGEYRVRILMPIVEDTP